MSVEGYAEALRALTLFQVTESSVADTLDRLADIAVQAIPAAAVVGMTMLGEDGRPTTAVYTDQESPVVDEAQYAEGKGPCLDAWRTKSVVSIPVLKATGCEYPAFVAACIEHDIASTLSLPLVSGETGLGAMNLYARSEHAFTPQDEAFGLNLASAAATVLANVSAYWTAFDLGQNLTEAMRTRAVIEQAKGMLMAGSPDLTGDEAFDLLRRASQRENIKLNKIAQRIVDRHPTPTEDTERSAST